MWTASNNYAIFFKDGVGKSLALTAIQATEQPTVFKEIPCTFRLT